MLPAVLGFQLLLQPPAVTFRERLRVLRAHRFAWLAHAVVAAGYAVLYATVTDGSERVPAGDAGLVAAARDSVFRVLVPGLFGGPWTKGGSGNTLFADPGSIGAICLCARSRGSSSPYRASLGMAGPACLGRGGRLSLRRRRLTPGGSHQLLADSWPADPATSPTRWRSSWSCLPSCSDSRSAAAMRLRPTPGVPSRPPRGSPRCWR